MNLLRILLSALFIASISYTPQLKAFNCFDELVRVLRSRPGVDFLPLGEAITKSHPAQHLLGIPRISVFKRELLSANWLELRRILELKPVPYVLGPNGVRYIIDRHHTLHTINLIIPELEKKGINTALLKVEMQQVADFSKMPETEFLAKMVEDSLMYPRNIEGINDAAQIPSHVSELSFDFYRGLAWIVRKSGAVKNTDVPFYEFYWADLFRKEFAFKKEKFTRKKIRKAIEFAIQNQPSQEALPGFRGQRKGHTVEGYMSNLENILKILEEDNLL